MNSILEEFKSKEGILQLFKSEMLSLIPKLFSGKLLVHQITGRVKELDSLEGKISRKGDKYSSIYDITDLVGIRLITYLESDVDRIAEVIEQEFTLDTANSIDKRKVATNEFGYKSLHYVVSLSDERNKLSEYKQYEGIKFEIQIRSILQHAWAEIEHDLGYKSEIGIPDALKRSFNRLSALLEVADVEFDRLKKELLDYEEKVPELIKIEPKAVEINTLSLVALYQGNQVLQAAKKIFSDYSIFRYTHGSDYTNLIIGCQLLGIETISDLKYQLEREQDLYLKFVKSLIETVKDELINGVPYLSEIMYFQHYLIAKTQDLSSVLNYLGNNYYFEDPKSAQLYIDIYSSIQN